MKRSTATYLYALVGLAGAIVLYALGNSEAAGIVLASSGAIAGWGRGYDTYNPELKRVKKKSSTKK